VRQWVEEAQGILWEHGAERLIDWLTGQEAKFCRSRKKRGALTGLRKYVQNREWLMDYPKYRTQKFQIGTGMMESTARQLVGLRRFLSGLWNRWPRALRLRCAVGVRWRTGATRD
jgi:hypothetical protein